MKLLLLFLAVTQINAQQQNGDQNEDGVVSEFQGSIPRFVGPNGMDLQDANYYVNVTLLFSCGFVFMITICFIGNITSCCKCIRCLVCCGNPNKKNAMPPEYRTSRYVMFSILLLCLILTTLGLGITGLVHNIDANKYVNGEGGIFPIIDSTLDEFHDFSEGLTSSANNLIDKINEMNRVNVLLDQFEEKRDNLTQKLDIDLRAALIQSTNDGCLNCDLSRELANSIDEINTKTDAFIFEVKDELGDLVQVLSGNDTDGVTATTDDLREITTYMSDGAEAIEDNNENIANGKSILKQLEDFRMFLAVICFVVPVFWVVLYGLGAGTKHTKYYGYNSWVILFGVFWMWVAFSTSFPQAVVFVDSCDYMDYIEENLADWVGDTGSELLVSCFDGSPLVEQVDVDLDDTLRRVQELNFTTNPIDPTNLEFTEFPALTSTILSFDDTDHPDAQSLSDLQQLTLGCEGAFQDLIEDAHEIEEEMLGVPPILEDVQEQTIRDFRALHCAFLGDGWRELQSVLCGPLARALILLTVSFFFLGLVSFYVVWVNALTQDALKYCNANPKFQSRFEDNAMEMDTFERSPSQRSPSQRSPSQRSPSQQSPSQQSSQHFA